MIKVQLKLHANALQRLKSSNCALKIGKITHYTSISHKFIYIRGLHSSRINLAHDRSSVNTRKPSQLSDKIISGWISKINTSKTFESKLEILQQLHNFQTEDGRLMVSNETVMKTIEHSFSSKSLTMESAVAYLDALAHAGATLDHHASLISPSLKIIASQPKKLLDPTTLPGFLQTLLKLNIYVDQMATLHTKLLKMVENSLTVGLAEQDEVSLTFNAFAVGIKPSTHKNVVSWLEKVSSLGYANLKPNLHGIVRFLAGVSSTGLVSNDNIMAHAQKMLNSMTERSLIQTTDLAHLNITSRFQILSLLESLVSLQISFSHDQTVKLGLKVNNAIHFFLPLANKTQLPTVFQAMHVLGINWQKMSLSGKSSITSKFMEFSWKEDSPLLCESLQSLCILGPRWINLEDQLFQKHLLDIVVPASLAVEEEEKDGDDNEVEISGTETRIDDPFYVPEEDTGWIDAENETDDSVHVETLDSEQQTDMLHFFSFLKSMGSLRVPFNVLSEPQQNHLLFSAQYSAQFLEVNEIGDLLQGLGRMGVSVRELRERDIIEEVFKATKRSKELSGPGLCRLFNGFQDARYNWQQLSNDETQIIFDAIAKFQSSKQDVDYYPLVIHGFATSLGLYWSDFPPTVKRDILRMINETSGLGWDGFALSKVIFSLGKIKIKWQDMPPWLQDTLLDGLNNENLVLENPHSFYLIVQGLANMKVLWTPLFYKPLQVQFIGIPHFLLFELSLCLGSLAHVQASWNTFSDPFKMALTQHLQTLLPDFRSEKSICSILYSIAMLAFDTNVEADRALLQILVEVKKRLQVNWGQKRFKDATSRREAQIFFEFLATFPFGQSMIAEIYRKSPKEQFIPTFPLDVDMIRKREKENQEHNNEIFDYIIEVMQPYGLTVQRDVNLFRGVFITDFVIVNPNKDSEFVAFVDTSYLLRQSLGRKRSFKEHLINFHFPNKPTCVVNLRTFLSWQQQLDELVTQICLQNNFRRQGSPAPPARLKERSTKQDRDDEYDNNDDY